jgi:small neutral amino acid transporter SnatA (MarC family)
MITLLEPLSHLNLVAAATPGSTFIGFAALFGAMFAIANPLAAIPFFLGYASPLKSASEKILGALLTTAVVWIGCVLVLFAGDAVLSFLGISIPGLKVGGGFVILLSGIAMMKMHVDDAQQGGRSLWGIIKDLVRKGHAPATAAVAVTASSSQAADSLSAHEHEAEAAEHFAAVRTHLKLHAPDADPGEKKNRRAAYLVLMFPFAVPLILGPGFTSTILIGAQSNPRMTVLAAFTVLMAIQIVVFALGSPINRVIGSFGMNILVRLVGLVVIILAFEIMISGGLTVLLPGLAK